MNSTNADLLIIGGGINGTGIAADAVGRGLSVILCEKSDMAAGTSSYSSKLIHGGLRYLEQYEFKLVREALKEREILMHKAPHLIHPLSFILPHDKHLRPMWMIRIGLFLYDHLARRSTLSASKKLDFTSAPEGKPLKEQFKYGFFYSDCRTDDARLVILNALAAHAKGAKILTRTTCISAQRKNNLWSVQLKHTNTGTQSIVKVKAIVNATGPWVTNVLKNVFHLTSVDYLELVKGSHIVIPKLYEGKHAYILQNLDHRIVFAIPYFEHFTLIGTTDVPYTDDPSEATISNKEIEYLCKVINYYFKQQISIKDIIWSYSGVRALFSNPSKDPSKMSREYHLDIKDLNGTAPLLSVFGGKLTTFRTLAEHALDELTVYFPHIRSAWTAHAVLPGGDLQDLSFSAYVEVLKKQYAWLPHEIIKRYANSYGSLTHQLLENCFSLQELGKHFGAGLYEREVNYLIQHEWAQTTEDIIWRRSKLGLLLNEKERQILSDFIKKYL